MAALFDNAHDALTFAYRYSGRRYAISVLNDTPRATTGKGLGGLDGAAQAGIIKAEVARLGQITEAIIIARFALPWLPCSCGQSCCSGKKVNGEWKKAITELATQLKNTALAGCRCSAKCRFDYVVHYFGGNGPLSAIADRERLHRNSVMRQYKLVSSYFRGNKKTPALENAALAAAEEKLSEIGII